MLHAALHVGLADSRQLTADDLHVLHCWLLDEHYLRGQISTCFNICTAA